MTQKAERAAAALRAAEATVGVRPAGSIRPAGDQPRGKTGALHRSADTPKVADAPAPENSATPSEADVSSDQVLDAEAREIVFRQLAMMPRSRYQLTLKLKDRGIDEETSERVLDRFEAAGLVDDASFAEAFVRSKRQSRGLSRRGLILELKKVGVSGEIAAEAVAHLDDEDDLDLAIYLAEKKAGNTRGLEYRVRERRIASMLSRKGFSGSIALRATREVLARPSYQ